MLERMLVVAFVLSVAACEPDPNHNTSCDLPDGFLACVFGSLPDAGPVYCGDTSTSAVCVEGKWECPPNWFPASACECWLPERTCDGGPQR